MVIKHEQTYLTHIVDAIAKIERFVGGLDQGNFSPTTCALVQSFASLKS